MHAGLWKRVLASFLARNVVKHLSAILLSIGFLMLGFAERKQTIHDIMAGCLVVRVR